MKCKQTQQRLLATSGPRKLSHEIQSHLDRCPRCRRWHARLDEIDRNIPHLPVPSSAEAKAALIEQILVGEPATPQRGLRIPGTRYERVLVALAASVLVVIGIAVYRGGRPPDAGPTPNDPLLAKLLKHNLDLANDRSPEKTMAALAALARDLDGETRNLARVAKADDLNALAKLYDDVVRKGIVTRADDVPLADRKKVLGEIASDLFATSSAVDELAKNLPASAAVSLNMIAAAARDGNAALRIKMQDEKVAHDNPPPVREGTS